MPEYIPIEKLGGEIRKQKVKKTFRKIGMGIKQTGEIIQQIRKQDFSIKQPKKKKGLFDLY